jgi:membrane protease subunit HflK
MEVRMAPRNVTPIRINLKPKTIAIIVLAAAVLILFGTSFFVVDSTERAVVTTFGKFSNVAEPGLHWKFPFGIQRNYNVKTEVVQVEEFGYRTERTGVQTVYSSQEFPEEATMLTGDLNIVDVEWIIQYKITDPKAWLFNVQSSERIKTIRDISRSAMNMLVGDRTILNVLGPERVAIETSCTEIMNETLSQYDMGVRIIAVKLQNIVPPKGVQEAFEDVNKAIQDMNRLINEGKEAYNQEIPKARGQADQMIQVARGYAAERVNKAKGDVARFASVYSEYRKAPEVTRERLYYEMVEQVFEGEKSVDLIDKELGNFIPFKALGTGGKQ